MSIKNGRYYIILYFSMRCRTIAKKFRLRIHAEELQLNMFRIIRIKKEKKKKKYYYM